MPVNKHCRTCACNEFVASPERERMQKLFSDVPKTGCLDYRTGKYCGKTVYSQDRCKEHWNRSIKSTRTGV